MRVKWYRQGCRVIEMRLSYPGTGYLDHTQFYVNGHAVPSWYGRIVMWWLKR